MAGINRDGLGLTVETDDDVVNSDEEYETQGINEEWLFEDSVDFDAFKKVFNGVRLTLTGFAWVSGGSAVVRVRIGGTAGQPDGTLALASEAIEDTAEVSLKVKGNAHRPHGVLPVKVTLQCSDGDQTAYGRSLKVLIRGA